MKLYGALLSPFVRKVAVVAQFKGIAWELTPFRSAGGMDPAFAEASPLLKMPAIDDDGYTLADSTAICLYLDAKYPEHRVIPTDPQALGRTMWFEELMDAGIAPCGLKVLFHRFVSPMLYKKPGNEDVAREGEAELPRFLDYLEQVVPADGWLVGDGFTLADISVASILRTLTLVKLGPSEERPRTLAWYKRVQAHPAWAAVAAIEDAPPK